MCRASPTSRAHHRNNTSTSTNSNSDTTSHNNSGDSRSSGRVRVLQMDGVTEYTITISTISHPWNSGISGTGVKDRVKESSQSRLRSEHWQHRSGARDENDSILSAIDSLDSPQSACAPGLHTALLCRLCQAPSVGGPKQDSRRISSRSHTFQFSCLPSAVC